MSSYAGLDEQGLRKLLDTSSDITERRQIRAALRELRANNNNIAHGHHYRAPISSTKLSHHQSFRQERRRRPENDDATTGTGKKHSQDDDILYRSRRKREMERREGGGGEDGDDENEDTSEDVELKIKEIGDDELKLTKLLSETRDFGDRRKVRSAIREVKRKKIQDEMDALQAKSKAIREKSPSPSTIVQKENQTNLVLSRSAPQQVQSSNEQNQEAPGDNQTNLVSSRSTKQEGQRSCHQYQEAPGEDRTTLVISRSDAVQGQSSAVPNQQAMKEDNVRGTDVEEQIKTLQKQLETTKTYEERRKIRAEIRELRQKKNGVNDDATIRSPARYDRVEEAGPPQLRSQQEANFGSSVNGLFASAEGKRVGSHVRTQEKVSEEVDEDEDWGDEDDEEEEEKVERKGVDSPYDHLERKEVQSDFAARGASPFSETQLLLKDPDSGYAEPNYYDPVAGNELVNTSNDTDIPVDLLDLPINGEDNKLIANVDTVGNKTNQGSNAGNNTASSSTSAGSEANDYEIIPPLEFRNQSGVFDSGECIISDTISEEHCLPPSPVTKSLPSVAVKSKTPVFQKEEKMNRWKEEMRKTEEQDEVVRNLLPSQIKKQQSGGTPSWLKDDKVKKYRKEEQRDEPREVGNMLPSEIKKKQSGASGFKVNTRPVTARTQQPTAQQKSQTLPADRSGPANPAVLEVVKRPEGSRRARIIRSFLELEKIKKHGPNAVDRNALQITAPSMLMNGNGMKAVSGAGGNLRGSDQMLEDMINLQLLQAMGVDPHSVAGLAVEDTASTPSPGPQRPSHLEIPSPIKSPAKPQNTRHLKPSNGATKVVNGPSNVGNGPSRGAYGPTKVGNGPSKGIAQMMNRFGGGTPASSQKQGFQGSNSNVKPSVVASSHSKPSSFPKAQSTQFSNKGPTASPFGKGLKKTGARNAFQIDVNGDDVEISLKDASPFMMNKLASPRVKAATQSRPSNSPSYNNNSSNTNSNNSRGLVATCGSSFESSIKPEGVIILQNHGVRDDDNEDISSKPAKEQCHSRDGETSLSRAKDFEKEKKSLIKEEEDKKELRRKEDPKDGSNTVTTTISVVSSTSSSSAASSSTSTSFSPVEVALRVGDAKSPVSGAYSESSAQDRATNEGRLTTRVVPSTSSLPSPSSPSMSSSSSSLPYSISRVKSTDDSNKSIDSSTSGPVLDTVLRIQEDGDDEGETAPGKSTTASVSVKTRPSPIYEKKLQDNVSSSPSFSSSSSSSTSSSGSASGSSSEADENGGQGKRKRAKGLKEAMRRRAKQNVSPSQAEKVQEQKTEISESVIIKKVSSPLNQQVSVDLVLSQGDRMQDNDNKQETTNLKLEKNEDSKVNISPSKDEGKNEEKKVKEEQGEEKRDQSKEEAKSPSPPGGDQGSPLASKTSDISKTTPENDTEDSNSGGGKPPLVRSTSKVTITLHSPVHSNTTFPMVSPTSSSSISPTPSPTALPTSEMGSSAKALRSDETPAQGAEKTNVSTDGPDTEDGVGHTSNKADPDVEGQGTRLPDKLDVDRSPTRWGSKSPTTPSPTTPTSKVSTRSFGHPFLLNRTRDDNAIPSPKKTTTSVRRSESAVSSLQAKRNKFLGIKPRADDDEDVSPTSPSGPAKSFKNIAGGNKFAALREKFCSGNGNDNNNTGKPRFGGGYSPTSTSPKPLWQRASTNASSSSSGYGSITEEGDSEQKRSSIYSTPPTTPVTPLPYKTPPTSPVTPLPYKTPPTSPLDLKKGTSPLPSSTPVVESKSPAPTAAQLKRQFLFGTDQPGDGEVFLPDTGKKNESVTRKECNMAPIEQIEDEALLEKMLEEATEFDDRKKIRSRLREVRKKKRDDRQAEVDAQQKAFAERMHKMEVESAQAKMKAAGINIIAPGRPYGLQDTDTHTSNDDDGVKSQTVTQESTSVTVGPGGSTSSSVKMSSTEETTKTTAPAAAVPKGGRPQTKFQQDLEAKKKEREEKRKEDEKKFKEQQMLRKKQEYERKKQQEEEAKNRKAALMNKFGGSGGGAKPAGGGGGMKVQNATTIKQKLLEWAQRCTRGYPGVNVTNFSSSWCDGMAFCALIHHYFPDAFDFSTLDPKQRRKNFDLAFNTAEELADIMPLLDTDDMIMMKNQPDWKCVFTYVQSLYRHLNKRD